VTELYQVARFADKKVETGKVVNQRHLISGTDASNYVAEHRGQHHGEHHHARRERDA
jgi:hypothetical protein